jgi:hypothetical protein
MAGKEIRVPVGERTSSEFLRERSHAELRAARMLAGKQIVRLNFGKRDDPVLPILRRVRRDARAAAKRQGITVRVRLETKDK